MNLRLQKKIPTVKLFDEYQQEFELETLVFTNFKMFIRCTKQQKPEQFQIAFYNSTIARILRKLYHVFSVKMCLVHVSILFDYFSSNDNKTALTVTVFLRTFSQFINGFLRFFTTIKKVRKKKIYFPSSLRTQHFLWLIALDIDDRSKFFVGQKTVRMQKKRGKMKGGKAHIIVKPIRYSLRSESKTILFQVICFWNVFYSSIYFHYKKRGKKKEKTYTNKLIG